jgi:hypothetical protein
LIRLIYGEAQAFTCIGTLLERIDAKRGSRVR